MNRKFTQLKFDKIDLGLSSSLLDLSPHSSLDQIMNHSLKSIQEFAKGKERISPSSITFFLPIPDSIQLKQSNSRQSINNQRPRRGVFSHQSSIASSLYSSGSDSCGSGLDIITNKRPKRGSITIFVVKCYTNICAGFGRIDPSLYTADQVRPNL